MTDEDTGYKEPEKAVYAENPDATEDMESGIGATEGADIVIDKTVKDQGHRDEMHVMVDVARVSAGDESALKKYITNRDLRKRRVKALKRVLGRIKLALTAVRTASLLPLLLNPVGLSVVVFIVAVFMGLLLLRNSGKESMHYAGNSIENSVVRSVTGDGRQKDWLPDSTGHNNLTGTEKALIDEKLKSSIETVRACYEQITKDRRYSSFTEEDLYEMGIDRESFAYILEEDGDFNTGAVLGDYATITLDIEGDDSYSFYDYDEVHEWRWVECSPYESGATAMAYGMRGGYYELMEVDMSKTYSVKDGKYVEDPGGGYYACGNGYVYVSDVVYMSWREIITPSNKLVMVPNAKKRLSFELTDKWMYREYPVDFEYYTLLSSYMFMERHGNTYFSLGGDSVYTVEKDELYELGEKLRSEFLFYELPCTVEEDGEPIEADVFEAFIRYNGAWADFKKWRDDWKKGVKFTYDGLSYYTNGQIKSLYKSNNAYGNQLLKGEPQKVIWYWLDYTIQQYDVNGRPVTDPVIHKTVTYFPVSCLNEVTTLIASYTYSPAVEDLEPKWRDCTELPRDFKLKYPLTWECISGDRNFTDNPKLITTTVAGLCTEMQRQITQQDDCPFGTFRTDRMTGVLEEYAAGKDPLIIAQAVSETPGGVTLAHALTCAVYYDGEPVDGAISVYNSGLDPYGDTEYGGTGVMEGRGGLRYMGIVNDEEPLREQFGVSGTTKWSDIKDR